METKEKIIKVAMKLLVSQGFENTPTSQISKESEVATGTLFHHFKTKEDLINEAYLYVKRKMIEAMSIDSDLPVKDRLKKSWVGALDYGSKNKVEIDFLILFSGSVYISKLSHDQGREIFEPFTGIIKQGRKEGVLKNLPQEVLENIYYSILKTMCGDLSSDKKMVNKMFEVAWDAIKA